jgi:hypothetical protein
MAAAEDCCLSWYHRDNDTDATAGSWNHSLIWHIPMGAAWVAAPRTPSPVVYQFPVTVQLEDLSDMWHTSPPDIGSHVAVSVCHDEVLFAENPSPATHSNITHGDIGWFSDCKVLAWRGRNISDVFAFSSLLPISSGVWSQLRIMDLSHTVGWSNTTGVWPVVGHSRHCLERLDLSYAGGARYEAGTCATSYLLDHTELNMDALELTVGADGKVQHLHVAVNHLTAAVVVVGKKSWLDMSGNALRAVEVRVEEGGLVDMSWQRHGEPVWPVLEGDGGGSGWVLAGDVIPPYISAVTTLVAEAGQLCMLENTTLAVSCTSIAAPVTVTTHSSDDPGSVTVQIGTVPDIMIINRNLELSCDF